MNTINYVLFHYENVNETLEMFEKSVIYIEPLNYSNCDRFMYGIFYS